MTKTFKPSELLELISQEADEFLQDATNCEPDEINTLITEIEQWLTDLKENLPLPLLEQAQPSKLTAERALTKLKRKSPKSKQWKGAEIQPDDPPEPPPPPPAPPPPSPPSEPEPPKITKV